MAKALTLKTIFHAIDKMSGPTKTITASVSKFGKAASIAGKVGGAMAKGAAAIAGTALVAGAAVGRAALAFAQRGDDIDRNARILGLTAQAYQELAYAANLADVDQAAFAGATKKLNNNLGQLKLKTGSLYTLLEKSNPALARQLKAAQSTDEAFDLMADAISRETNVQKRAALAQAAFGKSGQELIPMMEGLAKVREEARRSGSIISDADVAAASALDDSIKRINAAASGPLNAALGAIAAKLAPIVERVSAWISANREMIGQRIDQVFGAVERVVNALAPAFAKLAPALEPLWDLLIALMPLIEGLAKVLGWVVGIAAKGVGKVADVASSILGSKSAQGRLSAAAQDSPMLAGAAYGFDEIPALGPANAYSESRSTVDINLHGDRGVNYSARQDRPAPGVSLNLGPTMGSLGGAR